MEIQYSQLKINHLNDTPSTNKAARGGIFSGVFQQGRQGTSQGQEDFELSWYLFFQQVEVDFLGSGQHPWRPRWLEGFDFRKEEGPGDGDRGGFSCWCSEW